MHFISHSLSLSNICLRTTGLVCAVFNMRIGTRLGRRSRAESRASKSSRTNSVGTNKDYTCAVENPILCLNTGDNPSVLPHLR